MSTRLHSTIRKSMAWLGVLLAALLAPAALRAQSADIVLHNAKVLTVDKNFTVTQAIAITGNKITATGTNDDMLKLVPDSLREAAVALGAPTWKMIVFVSYRAARAGIITGILLAVARISGETAPLLFTALNNQFFSTNMNAPMANLPVVIFQFAMSPYDNWIRLAWGGALLITLTVLVLNIIARVFFRDQTKH